jgi:cell fate regulator YaaT (PSP1 superfamily)
MGLAGVKIVASEFSFDGARLSYLFSSEGDEKIDLRNLRRAMQRVYPHAQVEMHQIGPRDVAKILGGMGACGMENRCCSKFLTEFSPISIKMAKEQGISLTPTEITGMCGRLRCCLVYEYEQYVEARKQLPKRGKRVVTPQGEGKVSDIYPLKGAIVVELENGVAREFMKDEVQPWDELEALRQKSQAPCDRHLGGGCDCGRPANEDQTGSAP